MRKNVRQQLLDYLSASIKITKWGSVGVDAWRFWWGFKKTNRNISKLLTKNKLDGFSPYTVGTTDFAVYTRRKNKFDFCLETEKLKISLVDGGYEEFGARLHRDHRFHWFDLDTIKLFVHNHILID